MIQIKKFITILFCFVQTFAKHHQYFRVPSPLKDQLTLALDGLKTTYKKIEEIEKINNINTDNARWLSLDYA